MMESAGLVIDALGRVRDMVRGALQDLSPAELLAPPKPPIAWLVWHLSRVQDSNFSGLMERSQLWIADGWHARFNMPPHPKDYGSGHRHTRAQVDAFAVSDKQLLLDYLDAVFAQTKDYLSTIKNADLNRVLNEPPVSTAAHVEHSARQRDRLQHAPRRSNRISAGLGQASGLVSGGCKMIGLTGGDP